MHTNRWRKPAAAGILLLGLSLVASACGSAGGGGGGAGNGSYGPQQTVIEATDIEDAVTLDPQVAFEFASVAADVMLYQRLVKFPAGDMTKPVGDVAQDNWEVSDDGMHWTFHLKKGIKFSSGNELTSADVIYSMERVVNLPKDPAAWLITQMGITKDNVDQVFTAPDKYTVKVDLPQQFSPGSFLAVMANTVAGIVDSKTVKQHVKNGDYGSAWLFNHSAGSGPYVLKQWTKDDRMDFTANPNYSGDLKIKHVVWLDVPETSARLDMLKKGDADIAQGLSYQQVQSIKDNADYTVYKKPDQAMTYLGMGVTDAVPALSNNKVRQAIKYAIDYDGIVNNLLHGFGQPLQGVIPAGVFGYTDTTYFKHDVAKAKALMQEAGYGDGFTVEMLTPTGTVFGGIPGSALANVLKQNLADIGITVNIRQLESGQMYTQYRSHKAQLIIAGWGMDYPDPQDFVGPFAEYSQQSLIWRLSDNDKDLEALGDKAATMQNTPQRADLYKQLNQLEAQQGPFALLYQPYQVFVYSKKLQNFKWDHVNSIGFWVMSKSK